MTSVPLELVGLPLAEAQGLLDSVGVSSAVRMTAPRRFGPGRVVLAAEARVIQQRTCPSGTVVLVAAYPLQAPEQR